MRTSAAVIIALAGSLLLAGPARADRRIFAFTYPYMTLPGGSFEMEHYLDLGLQGWDDPATAAMAGLASHSCTAMVSATAGWGRRRTRRA